MTGRRLVLGNGDVRISYVVAAATSPLYRNGIGDECFFVERGRAARVETVFGAFDVAPGDYVSSRARRRTGGCPARGSRGSTAIEANSHIAPPKRYLSRFGQLLEHAPYCERDLRAPTGRCWPRTSSAPTRPRSHQAPRQRAGRRRRHGVHLRRPTRSTSSAGTAASTPTCSTSRTSSRSPAASTSRRRCTRCSRAATSSSATSCRASSTTTRSSIPVPYYHSNVDSDEVMFYVDGDYEPRKGSGIGRARSRSTPAGTRTARSRARPRRRSGSTTSTSWPSWSTRSARCELGEAGQQSTTASTPGPGLRASRSDEPPSHG